MVILRETKPLRVRFDVAGSVALTFGVGGLMYALGSVRSPASFAAWIPAALVLGVVGLAAFVWIEKRVEAPLLPLDFFRSANFSATLATNAFTSAAYMGAFVVAPILLLRLGYSVTAASYIVLIRTASLTIFSPLGGRVGEEWGEREGLGRRLRGDDDRASSCSAWAAWGEQLSVFVAGLVLQGAGHGLSQPSITAAIARSVAFHDLGIAGAANRLMGQGGAAFGITLLALAYGGRNSPEAFALAFAVGGVLSALLDRDGVRHRDPSRGARARRIRRPRRAPSPIRPRRHGPGRAQPDERGLTHGSRSTSSPRSLARNPARTKSGARSERSAGSPSIRRTASRRTPRRPTFARERPQRREKRRLRSSVPDPPTPSKHEHLTPTALDEEDRSPVDQHDARPHRPPRSSARDRPARAAPHRRAAPDRAKPAGSPRGSPAARARRAVGRRRRAARTGRSSPPR